MRLHFVLVNKLLQQQNPSYFFSGIPKDVPYIAIPCQLTPQWSVKVQCNATLTQLMIPKIEILPQLYKAHSTEERPCEMLPGRQPHLSDCCISAGK